MVIDTLGAGGKERRFTELVKALKTNREIDLEIVIMSNDIHFSEIYNFGINIRKVIRKSKKDISVYKKFWKILRNYKPDATHCWESMTAIYMAPLCKILNLPLINGMVTNVPLCQNIFNHHWLRARFTFPFSRAIVSNSQAGLTAYRVPSGRGIVIHNGFNFSRLDRIRDKLELRHELDISTEFVVGMVASFWKSKDYPTYYKAALSILNERNDVTFLAIGTDTDSEASYRLVDDKIESFRLLGKRTDIESCINIFDIGVLASFTEGLSNSIIEYMALGKPVVASEVGGTPELIIEGETGFMVKPADSCMLAERITGLLNDADMCKKMGFNGKNRIERYFSIERMKNEYINLYRKVCES
ncbi:MAG: glycosyltransferase [Bacteroidales bacterium]|nr:glycosyltransferase [Bacteroidales bacterium]